MRITVYIYTLREFARHEFTNLSLEGGVRVCGIAVLGDFWCGVAVSLNFTPR